MKTILATILIFSFTGSFTSPKRGYVHTREFVSTTEWTDEVTVQHDTYLDLDYVSDEEGITVTVLGCKVDGLTCDSPANFKRLVERSRRSS